jgi:hypothetical protein
VAGESSSEYEQMARATIPLIKKQVIVPVARQPAMGLQCGCVALPGILSETVVDSARRVPFRRFGVV